MMKPSTILRIISSSSKLHLFVFSNKDPPKLDRADARIFLPPSPTTPDSQFCVI